MTIEELLQENERLKKENELLRGIDKDDFFNFSADFLCTFFRRRFLQVSPSFVKALGYEKSFLLSQNLTYFLHPEEVDSTNRTILDFVGKEGDLYEYQNRYRKADGNYLTVSWQLHIKANGVAYAVGRDVTRQQGLEKALVQSKQLLKAVFNSTATIFVILDTDFKIIKLNENAQRVSQALFGYHLTIGDDALAMVQPEVKAEFQQRLQAILAGESAFYERMVEDKTTKEHHWYQISLTPLYVNYAVAGVCYAAHDISHQKAAQKKIEDYLENEKVLTEELRSQYEELLQNMEEMKAMQDFLKASEEQAKKSQIELQYKNNELDTFVYRASHDLRGPIATVLGLYEVMKLEVLDVNKSQEYLQIIQQSITRLNGILDELIGLNKIKETAIEEKEIDFHRLLNQIKINLVDTVHYNLVRWETYLQLASPIYTDENLLRIIIQNLAENALMFARIHRNDPYLRIEITKKQPKQLQIKVIDNGQGIREEAISKLFNMFYRASENSKGSGLGLYILKNALDKLEGTVQVETAIGKGTVFTVVVPLKR